MIATAVAIGVVALALWSTGAPAPREVYAILSLAVWGLAIAGIVTGILPRAPITRPAIWAGVCLAGFTCLTTLSVLWASDPGNAFDQAARASAYVGVFVLVLLASRDAEGGAWLRGLALGLGAIAVIALAPALAPGVFGTPEDNLGVGGRIGYPVAYWNGLAALMAAAIALFAWLATRGSMLAERRLAFAALPLAALVLYMTHSRGGIAATAAALALLVIAGPERQRVVANLALAGAVAVPLFLYTRTQTAFLADPGTSVAQTQGARVAVALALTLAAAWWLRGRLDRRLARLRVSRRTATGVAVAAGVIALAGLVAIDPAQRVDDFTEAPTEEQLRADQRGESLFTRSGGGRWQFWGAALDAFAERPLAGIGAGEFGYYWNQHGAFGIPVQNAHSLFLEALAELGILGFALITGFFGIALVVGVMRSQYFRDGTATAALALVAAGVVSALFDFVWELPAVFVPVVIAAALLTGSALTPPLINAPPAPAEPPRRSLRGLALAGATLAVGWTSIVACGWVLLTEAALDRSRDAVSEKRFGDAIDAAAQAVDLQPWAAQPRLQLGLAYQRAGDFASARDAYREAVERADQDWRYWGLYLPVIESNSGNFAAACKAIERARELNPRQALLYQELEFDCPGLRKRPPPLVG